jgi:glucose/arabinose dehydrogenase
MKVAVTSLLACLCLAAPGAAATVPANYVDRVVAGGLSRATAMALAADGRIFVSEQGGALRVIKRGVLLPTPFVSLTVDSPGERGLLGVAFDPNFASNHYVYAYYTATSPGIHNRASRFSATGDTAVPGSEHVLLDLNNLSSANNHNGGALHFGLDGKLYISTGDNANSSNAQTLSNLLGKILRINKDGSIPADNPFYGTATGRNRAIWALGLRNPFTFEVNRVSGRMFIDDVGASTREEIDDGIAGANYGWPHCEGPCSSPNSAYTDPRFSYAHGSTSSTGCAVTGGAFYAPQRIQFPSRFANDYFFADLCSGWIRYLHGGDFSRSILFATGISQPVDLDVGSDGSLYYLARGSGEVHRVSYLGNPRITGFSPTSGSAAQRTWARILGGYLAGVTSVGFNGHAASAIRVVSDVELYAKVPADATTGPITLTTPAGTATSVGTFTVTS